MAKKERAIVIKEKSVIDPLEAIFDVEPESTMVEYEEIAPTETEDHITYDQKDDEIEDQFQTIYDAAMDAYETQTEDTKDIDPKYRARNAEVSANYLNTALSAAKEKANLKKHKDTLSGKKNSNDSSGTTNNLMVMDRETILGMLNSDTKEEKIIES
jgi:hypothetical protein